MFLKAPDSAGPGRDFEVVGNQITSETPKSTRRYHTAGNSVQDTISGATVAQKGGLSKKQGRPRMQNYPLYDVTLGNLEALGSKRVSILIGESSP